MPQYRIFAYKLAQYKIIEQLFRQVTERMWFPRLTCNDQPTSCCTQFSLASESVFCATFVSLVTVFFDNVADLKLARWKYDVLPV